MKNFTRILIATSLVVMVAFNSHSQIVSKLANVGIGTTTPAQKLDVAGSIKFSGALMPMPGGVANAGLIGNILLSGGAGAFPTWLANGTAGQVLMSSSGTPTWTNASAALANAWTLTGNSISATYGVNFIGTTNASGAPLEFYVNNAYAGVIDPADFSIYLGAGAGNDASVITTATDNVGIGWSALSAVASTDDYNTAIGYYALPSYKSDYTTAVGAYALNSVTTTDIYSSALGYGADYSITTGIYNDAIGFDANYFNQTGSYNMVAGDSAMFGNAPVTTGTGTLYTSSTGNTAIGVAALSGIGSSSTYNTAVGYEAERHITTAIGNTGIGMQVNYGITTGDYNTGVGYQANYNTTTSYYNTGVGYQANYSNVQGYGNVAVGANALYKNTWSGNTAIGTNALYNNNTGSITNGPNTAIGDSAMYTNSAGVKNVAVGYGALTAAGGTSTTNNLNTAIGYFSMVAATGASSIAVQNNVNIGAYTDATYTQESNDVAVGAYALSGGTAAANPSQDVAIGAYSMYAAGTGANYDIAIGSGTSTTTGPLGSASFTGNSDIAIGYEAGNYTTSPGVAITTGSSNILLGYEAYATVATASQNVAIGTLSHFGGNATANDNNTAIGYSSAATGTSNSTAIGEGTTASGASSTVIGAGASAAGTSTTAIGAGATVSSSYSNTTVIGPGATAGANNEVIIGNAGNVNGVSQINVGIGTTTPARELEVAGTTNTIRVDGLGSGGTFNTQLSTSTGNIVYVNTSTGDLYSLPNTGVTTGEVLTLNSTGDPAWAVSSAVPLATAPLVVSGSPATISLQGPTGSVLVGTGTGVTFIGTGAYGDVLEGLGAGVPPQWTTLASLAGSGDNWGSQVAVTDSDDLGGAFPTASTDNTITGNGLSSSPLRLAKQTATNNQVLLWNTAANTWLPGSASSSLTTYSVANGGASSVVVVGGGFANSVVGSGNVTVDVQGTSGGILYGKGAGTSAVFTTAGTTGQVLESNGSSAPTWTTLSLVSGWATTGNAGTIPGTNYIGTTTDAGFDFEVNGANAGAIDPLNTTNSAANVYLGAASTSTPILNGAGNNDAGDNNVGIGLSALGSAGGPSYVGGLNSIGFISSNVAVGVYALSSAVYGGFNTAVGAWSQRLFNYPTSNTTTGNTSVGAYSLYSNSNGKFNTSQGYYSMYGNGTATAVGNFNTAEGYKALYTAGAGIASNTAIGSNALYNEAASKNTAVGDSALASSTSGTYNTGLGYDANVSTGTLSNATAIGAYALAAQSNTLILGQANGIGNGTANTNVGIGTNTPDIDAGLAIKTLHLETQQTTSPTISTSNGTSAASVTGTDVGGVVNFTVPSSGGTGTQVSVTFVTPYSVAPSVIITAASSATGAIMGTYMPYVSNVTPTGFTINFTAAPSASVPLEFYYFIIETQ